MHAKAHHVINAWPHHRVPYGAAPQQAWSNAMLLMSKCTRPYLTTDPVSISRQGGQHSTRV